MGGACSLGLKHTSTPVQKHDNQHTSQNGKLQRAGPEEECYTEGIHEEEKAYQIGRYFLEGQLDNEGLGANKWYQFLEQGQTALRKMNEKKRVEIFTEQNQELTLKYSEKCLAVNMYLNKGNQLDEFLAKGQVPQKDRWSAWKEKVGLQNYYKKGIYDILAQKECVCLKVIMKDIGRTYTDQTYFKSESRENTKKSLEQQLTQQKIKNLKKYDYDGPKQQNISEQEREQREGSLPNKGINLQNQKMANSSNNKQVKKYIHNPDEDGVDNSQTGKNYYSCAESRINYRKLDFSDKDKSPQAVQQNDREYFSDQSNKGVNFKQNQSGSWKYHQQNVQNISMQKSIKLYQQDSANFISVGQECLLRVLKALSHYFPNFKYTQGMNFVVGFFLLMSGGNEEEAFWMFVSLSVNQNYLIMGLYENNFPLIDIMKYMLEVRLEKLMPVLHNHIRNTLEIIYEEWFFQWVITLFLDKFPLNQAVRFWDFIISEGSLFAVIGLSLSVLKELQSYLLDSKDHGDFHELLNKLKGQQLNICQERLLRGAKKMALNKKMIAELSREYIISQSKVISNNRQRVNIFSSYLAASKNVQSAQQTLKKAIEERIVDIVKLEEDFAQFQDSLLKKEGLKNQKSDAGSDERRVVQKPQIDSTSQELYYNISKQKRISSANDKRRQEEIKNELSMFKSSLPPIKQNRKDANLIHIPDESNEPAKNKLKAIKNTVTNQKGSAPELGEVELFKQNPLPPISLRSNSNSKKMGNDDSDHQSNVSEQVQQKQDKIIVTNIDSESNQTPFMNQKNKNRDLKQEQEQINMLIQNRVFFNSPHKLKKKFQRANSSSLQHEDKDQLANSNKFQNNELTFDKKDFDLLRKSLLKGRKNSAGFPQEFKVKSGPIKIDQNSITSDRIAFRMSDNDDLFNQQQINNQKILNIGKFLEQTKPQQISELMKQPLQPLKVLKLPSQEKKEQEDQECGEIQVAASSEYESDAISKNDVEDDFNFKSNKFKKASSQRNSAQNSRRGSYRSNQGTQNNKPPLPLTGTPLSGTNKLSLTAEYKQKLYSSLLSDKNHYTTIKTEGESSQQLTQSGNQFGMTINQFSSNNWQFGAASGSKNFSISSPPESKLLLNSSIGYSSQFINGEQGSGSSARSKNRFIKFRHQVPHFYNSQKEYLVDDKKLQNSNVEKSQSQLSQPHQQQTRNNQNQQNSYYIDSHSKVDFEEDELNQREVERDVDDDGEEAHEQINIEQKNITDISHNNINSSLMHTADKTPGSQRGDKQEFMRLKEATRILNSQTKQISYEQKSIENKRSDSAKEEKKEKEQEEGKEENQNIEEKQDQEEPQENQFQTNESLQNGIVITPIDMGEQQQQKQSTIHQEDEGEEQQKSNNDNEIKENDGQNQNTFNLKYSEEEKNDSKNLSFGNRENNGNGIFNSNNDPNAAVQEGSNHFNSHNCSVHTNVPHQREDINFSGYINELQQHNISGFSFQMHNTSTNQHNAVSNNIFPQIHTKKDFSAIQIPSPTHNQDRSSRVSELDQDPPNPTQILQRDLSKNSDNAKSFNDQENQHPLNQNNQFNEQSPLPALDESMNSISAFASRCPPLPQWAPSAERCDTSLKALPNATNGGANKYTKSNSLSQINSSGVTNHSHPMPIELKSLINTSKCNTPVYFEGKQEGDKFNNYVVQGKVCIQSHQAPSTNYLTQIEEEIYLPEQQLHYQQQNIQINKTVHSNSQLNQNSLHDQSIELQEQSVNKLNSSSISSRTNKSNKSYHSNKERDSQASQQNINNINNGHNSPSNNKTTYRRIISSSARKNILQPNQQFKGQNIIIPTVIRPPSKIVHKSSASSDINNPSNTLNKSGQQESSEGLSDLQILANAQPLQQVIL